jgi:glutamine amidotransferase PdxT
MEKTLRSWRSLSVLALALWSMGLPADAQTPGLSIQLNAACPRLSITGAVNARYAVQCVGNLSPTNNWQLITNLVLPTNPCVLNDTSGPAVCQRFYRVKLTNPALTVTDAQLQDMCGRMCDGLTSTNKIPETITIGGSNTNAVTAAEFHYLMVKWLRDYRNHANTPPATVTITQGTHCPVTPAGVEIGRIYLADILATSASDASYIDATSTLPDYSTVAAIQYTTKAMLWLYARTIDWYHDHSTTMPNYATVMAVTAPDSWVPLPPPTGIRVAVFTDPDGGSTAADCIDATIHILTTNGGFSVTTITGAAIRAGGLTNYDVVMFPGGSGSGEANALQQTGCAKVEQFVAHGGGYVGTCAGAFLAALGYNTATSWLEIADAQIIDVDHWDRGTGTAQIRLVNTNNVILAGFPECLGAHYFNGPLLGPGGSATLPDYEEDAVFVTDIHDNAPAGIMPGTTCMTTSIYQSGKCVLFSFHPELTPGLEQMDVRAVKWSAGRL